MIKILLYGDTHLGFDHPLRTRTHTHRRGEDFFRNFRTVLQYAKQNNIDLLLHGGDFFYRSKVPQVIVTKAYEILFDFAEAGIPTVIIPGNHERSVLPVSILTRHPMIRIFSDPGKFEFTIKDCKLGIYGFPFIRNDLRIRFTEIIQKFSRSHTPDEFRILAFHQSVEGAQVGPVNYTFRSGPDVIAMKDLPENYNLIFSGHIHRKQILWKKTEKGKVPVIYPGSTERTSFAEKDEAKGFYVVTIDSQHISNIEFVKLPARKMKILHIPEEISDLNSFRNWLQIEIDKLPDDSIIKFKNIVQSNSHYLRKEYLDPVLPEKMITQHDLRSLQKRNLLTKNRRF